MRKLGDYLLGFSVAFSVVCMMCFLAYFTNQSDKAIDEEKLIELYNNVII